MNLAITSNRRGFSLIEVLIAVMILSLGLLGLAAVFPVIIRQQRLAGDATQGIIVARSAEAYIRGNSLLNMPSKVEAGESDIDSNTTKRTARRYLQKRRGWDLWRFDCVDINGVVSEGPTYREVEISGIHLPQRWDVRSFIASGTFGLACDGTAADRGDNYIFGTNLLNTPPRQFEEPIISLRDRLWPAPYSAVDENWQENKYANEPRFVWDTALLRDDAGTPHVVFDDKVRVAVVVRRIDSAMRIPARDVEDDFLDPLAVGSGPGQRPSPTTTQYRGLRLADVLLGSTNAISDTNRTRLLSNQEYRVPVAVTVAGGNPPEDAMPTLDGKGDYAALRTVYIDEFEDPESTTGVNYTRMIFQPGLSQARLDMLRQPNQRFADNMGNVYTVVKVDDTLPNAVIISPPAPRYVREMAELDAQAVQVLYSPVPPAAISIFTIEPR